MALAAGFESSDAQIIAWAAQTVDELDFHKIRRLNKTYNNALDPMVTIEALSIKKPEMVDDTITIFNDHKTKIRKIIRGTWAPFHFLPGNLVRNSIYTKDRISIKEDVTVDGMKSNHKNVKSENDLDLAMVCRTNTLACLAIIDNAKKQYQTYYKKNGGYDRLKALCAVGICMHTLADTWSHQGFAGTGNAWINSGIHSGNIAKVLSAAGLISRKSAVDKLVSALPNIVQPIIAIIREKPLAPVSPHNPAFTGHGYVFTDPDIPGKIWSFEGNLVYPKTEPIDPDSDIDTDLHDNPKRYRTAFLQMHDAMRYIQDKNVLLSTMPFRKFSDLETRAVQGYDMSNESQEMESNNRMYQLISFISDNLFTEGEEKERIKAWQEVTLVKLWKANNADPVRASLSENMNKKKPIYEQYGGADKEHDELTSYKAFIEMAKIHRKVVCDLMEDPGPFHKHYFDNLDELISYECKHNIFFDTVNGIKSLVI